MPDKENLPVQPEKAAEKTPKKAESKPGFFQRIGRGLAKWFRDMRSEVKKIVWPTGKQTVNNTVVVIIVVIIVGAFIYVLDGAFGFFRDTLIRLF